MSTRNGSGKAPKVVRCAIYTRKSTTEGLEMDFNTLDAQREAAEHYIRSQAAQGWAVLPMRYDDGGYTGGNLERPALQRLLEDIDRGEVDIVVVYKVDRLSRSLLDFARVMERFEKQHVGFVSITQHFDTSTSMGRLVLNVLLSFAQFERELISERTRDKIAAARRRGKWTGGPPVLGYRIDRERRSLALVPEEAAVVRLVFELYLQTRSIGAVAEQLNALGHTQKRHQTKAGKWVGGKAWDKNAVHRLLRNPVYAGRVQQGGKLYEGEHKPIIRVEELEQTWRSLGERTRGNGSHRSRKSEYLLTGLLRCVPCGCAMTSSAGQGRNGKRYRYYRCRHAEHGGVCPTGLLTADEVEATVVSKVKELVARGDLQKSLLAELAEQDEGQVELGAQRERLTASLAELNAEARRLMAAFSGAQSSSGGKLLAERLGELEAEMDRIRVQLAEVEAQLRGAQGAQHEVKHLIEVVGAFNTVWDALVPGERRELLHLVVRQVAVDPVAKGIRILVHDFPALPEGKAMRGQEVQP